MHVYRSVSKASQERHTWRRITLLAVIAGVCLLITIGLAGYLSFRNSTQSNILNNFSFSSAYDVFQVILVIHLLLYIPGDLILLRYNFVKLFTGKKAEYLSFTSSFIIVCIVLASILGITFGCIASGASNGHIFAALLNITGGIGGSTLGFILPGILYLYVFPKEERSFHYTAYATVIFGIVVMIIVIAVIIAQPFLPILTDDTGPQKFATWGRN